MGLRDRLNFSGRNEYVLNADEDTPEGIQGNAAWSGELVPLSEMFDNVLVLKDGSFRMILEVSSINFDLKSDREQMTLLMVFGEMLNSLTLDFPLSVLLHAAHMDTRHYVRRYAQHLEDPSLPPAMRDVISDHIVHFERQARDNHLLDRSFYVVVSFIPPKSVNRPGDARVADDMPGGGFARAMMDGSGKEKTGARKSPRELEMARLNLLNRCEQVANQLSRLGVHSRILDELSTVQLLRELYNPGISEHQKIRSMEEFGGLVSVRVADENRTRHTNGGGDTLRNVGHPGSAPVIGHVVEGGGRS